MLLMVVVGLVMASCGDGESTVTMQIEVTTTTVAVTSTVPPTTVDDGPVKAEEAQIEMTYTGDEVSFVGDHEIIEGTVTVNFSNESTTTPILAVFGYETGSEALAQELEFLAEGERGVPNGDLPVTGFFEVDFDLGDGPVPGSHTWTIDLAPGTYIFDVGPGDVTTGFWRIAVIEVVAG